LIPERGQNFLHSERLKVFSWYAKYVLTSSCYWPFNIHHGVKGPEDGRASDGEADPGSEAGQDLHKKEERKRCRIVVEVVK